MSSLERTSSITLTLNMDEAYVVKKLMGHCTDPQIEALCPAADKAVIIVGEIFDLLNHELAKDEED